MSIRIFTTILMLAGYVAKKSKHTPKTLKTTTEDYYTVTSHIILRNFGILLFLLFCVVFCFFCFVFVVVVFCPFFGGEGWVGFLDALVVFGFFGFLVFGQGDRCKEKIEHFRKSSGAIGNFGNFRKQKLSEFSEGPRSEPI